MKDVTDLWPNRSPQRTFQILVVIAGLHLIGVVLHQMLLFQHELPHLDDASLPRGAETLLGSGFFLWALQPLIATLLAFRLDAFFPAPLTFIFDSLVWAALVLTIVRMISHASRRLQHTPLNPSHSHHE